MANPNSNPKFRIVTTQHPCWQMHLRAAVGSTATSLQRPTARPVTSVGAQRVRVRPFTSRGALQVCMVKTQSAELDVGMQAPDFSLPEPLTGKTVSLSDLAGSPVLFMVLCVHCPYVIMLKEAITSLAREYQAKGFQVVAISSNSITTHPQDGPEKMAEDAAKYGYTFPFLYDETQEVAKAYSAACTPEFYVLDKEHKLQYHGQFDDSRPKGDKPTTGKDLRAAMDAVLAGQPAPKSRPSIGCNIKWTPGNEPTYFGAQVVKA